MSRFAWLTVLPLAGCSIGAGSAYVGQWAPRKEVEFEACLLDDNAPQTDPHCKATKQVEVEVPGRRYWGVILPFPAIGAASVSFQGVQRTTFRAEPSFEFLRGAGRYALGVRTGVVIDSDVGDHPKENPNDPNAKGHLGAAFTTMMIGHVSIFDELGAYAGIGHATGGAADERTFVGARGLAGLQFAIQKTQGETFLVLSFEVDRTYLQLDDRYRSTGFTGHFGIFF